MRTALTPATAQTLMSRDVSWAMSLVMCICCDATLLRPIAFVALVGWVALMIITLINLVQMSRVVIQAATDELAVTPAEASLLDLPSATRGTSPTAAATMSMAIGFGLIALPGMLSMLWINYLISSHINPASNGAYYWLVNVPWGVCTVLGPLFLLRASLRLKSAAREVALRAPRRISLQIISAISLVAISVSIFALSLFDSLYGYHYGWAFEMQNWLLIANWILWAPLLAIFTLSALSVLREERFALDFLPRLLLTFGAYVIAIAAAIEFGLIGRNLIESIATPYAPLLQAVNLGRLAILALDIGCLLMAFGAVVARFSSPNALRSNYATEPLPRPALG